MRELDIRRLLRRRLIAEFGTDATAVILDEFSLCCGKVRADMAVVNGELKGFEIKSDQDTLRRLHSQAPIYGKVFDTVTIVTAPRHIREAREIVPSWWGIVVADQNSDSALRLDCIRQEDANPQHDPFALVQLIWRDEALELLRNHNLHTGLQSKPRKLLWEALVHNFHLTELQQMVRARLKARRDWPVVASRKRCDVTSRLSSMSSNFHSQRASSHNH